MAALGGRVELHVRLEPEPRDGVAGGLTRVDFDLTPG